MIVAARALLVDSDTWIEGGALVIERGVIQNILRSRAALRRARARRRGVLELEGLVVTPGLIDAHAHLDLGALRGRLAAERGFERWIRSLVRCRRKLTRRDRERSVLAGARTLIAGGTTCVGDIDASGTSARLGRELGLRAVVYREVLDAWDPGRTRAALQAVKRKLRTSRLIREGLSPHAPYTTSTELLAGASALSARRGLPLAVHWAETAEEQQWLEHGRGPFTALLPPSPRRSGLELLDAAGLLTPRTALIHGNQPRRSDFERIARSGASLVHCPGTHAFFARPPFPLERYRAAGVPLALGTDSLASNDELDMRSEMARLRACFPRLDPALVFAMATVGGAQALGLGGAVGRLRPGAVADLVAWSLGASRRQEALEELTGGHPGAEHSFVAGRVVKSP